MKKKKRYAYDPYDEGQHAYTIEGMIEKMKEDGASEMKIQEVKLSYGIHVHYCKKDHEIIETGLDESCGKECPNYQPRNGKSGYCRWARRCEEAFGPEYILNTNGELKEIKEK